MAVGGRRLIPDEPLLLPRPRSLSLDPQAQRAPAAIVAEHRDPQLPPEGYRLHAGPEGVRVTFADPAGRRHALSTVQQLAHPVNDPSHEHRHPIDRPGADPVAGPQDTGAGAGASPTVPACVVEDWPDLARRGVMLDVSRDKVPTLETLGALFGRLGPWKLEHVQLYTEHTFAYAGHEEVWRQADPYTADDLTRLDARAGDAGLALLPNQNTLGHFERWLRHPRYRALAIAPDGFDWLFGIHRNPTTLDPTNPAAFDLVADLLTQLAPVLPDRPLHVGLDEPWELGPERRPQWVNWLVRLRDLPATAGRELLVWGDVPGADPDLLAGWPDGVTVCEWGYEEHHPFAERVGHLTQAGVAAWVAPGTSSWLSVSGRLDEMLGNIANAARTAVDTGAAGLLVTDWGDMGFLQPFPASEPGLAAAAALSWCAASNGGLDASRLARLLDAFCYDDPAGALGATVVALGRVHRLVTPRPFNMSPLVAHLLLPQLRVGRGMTEGLQVEELDEVERAIHDALAVLAGARPRRADGNLLVAELEYAAALLRLGVDDARLRLTGDGSLAAVSEAQRLALARRTDELVEEHRRLWLARNRPGGLDDSAAWLEHLSTSYRRGHAERTWFGPLG